MTIAKTVTSPPALTTLAPLRKQVRPLVAYDDLIKTPPNPYLHFGKEFGKDEVLALGMGAVLTGATNFLLDSFYDGNCPLHIKVPILAVVQPAAEKPFLIFRHLRNAYREAPAVEKRSLAEHWEIIKTGLKDGFPTLRADLLYHDSIQAFFMGVGTSIIKPAASWAVSLIQIFSFTLAFGLAAALEVKAVDFSYYLFCRKLRKLGFDSLSYFESRYLIDPAELNRSPREILEIIGERFNLSLQRTLYYRDSYIKQIELDEFNGWKPYSRFRSRTAESGGGCDQSVQINFTRPFEVKRNDLIPYRFFTTVKRKFYFTFTDGQMYWRANQIPDPRTRRIVEKMEGEGEYKNLGFWRFRLQDPAGLLVAVDIPSDSSDSPPDLDKITTPFILEVKAWPDGLSLLKDANDFIMRNFPADPTTNNKLELEE